MVPAIGILVGLYTFTRLMSMLSQPIVFHNKFMEIMTRLSTIIALMGTFGITMTLLGK